MKHKEIDGVTLQEMRSWTTLDKWGITIAEDFRNILEAEVDDAELREHLITCAKVELDPSVKTFSVWVMGHPICLIASADSGVSRAGQNIRYKWLM